MNKAFFERAKKILEETTDEEFFNLLQKHGFNPSIKQYPEKEDMTKQIAYTAPFPGYCPEYVNLTFEDNGSNILTVRTNGEQDVSVINLPPVEMMKFALAMMQRAIEQGVSLNAT